MIFRQSFVEQTAEISRGSTCGCYIFGPIPSDISLNMVASAIKVIYNPFPPDMVEILFSLLCFSSLKGEMRLVL
jgi:hypothetical protein